MEVYKVFQSSHKTGICQMHIVYTVIEMAEQITTFIPEQPQTLG